MKIKTNIFIVISFLLFILPINGNTINEIKDKAQKAFIGGDYILSNNLFSNICIHKDSDFNSQKYAYRMKALLMEQYLSNIDSAIILYNEYYKNYCINTREKEHTIKKLEFLKSLGLNKKAYGKYQQIIFTNSNDLKRTIELNNFLKNHPDFFLKKEAHKQLAIAALNSNQFAVAYKAYNIIKKEFPPLSETEINQFRLSKRMYNRYLIILFIEIIWFITFSLFLYEIWKLLKKHYRQIQYPITPVAAWIIFLIIFISMYGVKVINSDHNPFRVIDIIMMSTVFTLSIFLNSFVILNNKNNVYKYLVTVLTTLTILGTAFFTTYNRPDKITVMDDLYDQVGDLFIKESKGE